MHVSVYTEYCKSGQSNFSLWIVRRVYKMNELLIRLLLSWLCATCRDPSLPAPRLAVGAGIGAVGGCKVLGLHSASWPYPGGSGVHKKPFTLPPMQQASIHAPSSHPLAHPYCGAAPCLCCGFVPHLRCGDALCPCTLWRCLVS